MTLRELPIGKDAKVIAVHGNSVVSRRLMEMGVVPGVSIKMIKAAPFGDPVEIRLLGYSLAIRNREADAVEVEV